MTARRDRFMERRQLGEKEKGERRRSDGCTDGGWVTAVDLASDCSDGQVLVVLMIFVFNAQSQNTKPFRLVVKNHPQQQQGAWHDLQEINK